MTPNSLSTLLFLLTIPFISYSADPIKLFVESEQKTSKQDEIPYSTLIVDQEVQAQIYNSKSSSLVLDVPYLGKNYEVELYSYDLLTPGFKLMTNNDVEIPYTPGVFYRGHISETGGLVAFTFFEDDIIGLMSTKKGKVLNIGKPAEGKQGEYVIYNTNDVKSKPNMDCGTEELPEYAGQLESMLNSVGSSTRMGDCVNFYVEADYDLNVNKGGVVPATDYLTGLWNPVATIFDEEDIEVNISEIFVWDVEDGYNNNNSITALNEFRDNNPTYNGDLAHLMSLGGNNIGGVAWLDVICSNNFGYAYSNINANYNSFPSYSWTVNVVTHEIGHNLGSPHTHSCSWTGGAIDGCVASEGSCPDGPDPVGGGTIMSYCHLTSFGVNFNNGFGPLPGDLIRDEVDSANCLGDCIDLVEGDPPVADFSWEVIESCAGTPAEVEYFDESADDPTEWLWTFPGGNPSTSTEQNPVVTYDAVGIYGATLEVTNAYGDDEITYDEVIDVEASPIALFDVTVLDGIAFTDNFSQFSLEYEWDFGDGFTSTSYEPFHEYAEDGFYTITLVGSNDCTDDTYSVEIEVATPPVAAFTMSNGEGCVSWDVEFTSTSSNNTDEWEWSFPGGNPSVSTDPDVTVTYNDPGVYDVTLTVSNETGTDTYTVVDAIIVQDLPISDFSYVINEGEVSFTNLSSDAYSYLWEFGDGSSSTSTNPVYTYLAGGTFTVSLTSTNDCGDTVSSQDIIIILEPEALFTYSSTEGCATHTVQYTDMSSQADTYFWEFEGGIPATSTEINPLVDYTEAGVFDVSLTVTNGFGDNVYELTDLVSIDDVPETEFSASADEGTVTFTNETTNANTYLWIFGDSNSSTEENPVHTYDEPGSYTVTLVATNDCGDSQYISQIVAAIPPIAGFASSSTEGCAVHTVTFTDESSNADSYLWVFDGGIPATSTEASPIVDYQVEGIYTVTLTVTNPYGTDELVLEDQVIINDVPTAEFSYTADEGNIDFSNESTNADSYLWDFGDGNTSTMTSPSHTYDSAGAYSVTLTATNECGTSEHTDEVIAAIVPIAGFSNTASDGCITHTVEFTSTSSDGESYLWEFEGGTPSTSTEENPVIDYTTTGTFDVSITVTNAYGSDEITLEDLIVVEDLPNTDFDYVTEIYTTTFTNVTEGGSNPTWDFGDGNTSTEDNPIHTYDTEGTYFVTLTTENNCGQSVQTEPVTISDTPSIFISANVTESCLPNATFTFSDESINSEEILWEFPGGNPSTSTDPNPTVTYDAVGTYDVIVIATNSSGSEELTFEDYVTVNDEPNAQFSVENDGLEINITNSSEYGNSYDWDFGDSSTSSEFEPNHTYDEEGLYTVTLEVTNQCGTSITDFEVNNYTLPSASITQNKEEACINENVRYFSNASDNAISFSWSLEGATPSTSTLRNPLVQYESGGTYSVTLVVSNPAGETTYTFDNTVEIYDEPISLFTQTNDALTTTFSNQSENGTTYLWDFGDGMTSTDVNPEHIYTEEGIYTVSLSTTNICGTETTDSEFHNYSLPTADFRQNKDFACVGENVRYIQEASSNSVEFEWSLQGANPSTSNAKNVLVTYDTPGTYDVTLTVSNPAGTDDLVKTSTVTIIEEPTTAFTVISDLFNVSFVDQGIGADTYSWDFGDGNTSTDQNPEHTYESDGSYEVILSTSNDCGTTTQTQTVVVSMRPTANFTTVQGIGNSACVPATIQYQNLSSSNVETVLWTFPGGSPSTSTEFDPAVTYDNVGTYEATLEVFSSDDSDAITIESVVQVVDQPVSSFTLSMDVLDIVATDESEYAESITWSVDGIEVGTGSEFSYLPMFNGQYEIEQTVVNACGEISSRQSIEVTTYPDASFSATERDICEGNTVSYTATFEDNLTYLWTFEGGEPSTSTEQNPTVTYPTIGIYPVALAVTNIGGDSDILSEDYVTVGEAPVAEPTFGLDGDSTIDASVEQIEGMSYEWYVNGELVSSTDALTYEMTETGTYNVTLIASNDCDELIINEEYQFVRSSTEDELFSDILIMPNPATEYLTINVDLSTHNGMEYRLLDITGNRILSGSIDTDNTQLNIENVPGGVYILSLSLNDKFKYEKIVISK